MARRQRAELCQMPPPNATARVRGPESAGLPLYRSYCARIGPKTGGPGSSDCKFGVQAPIRAGAVLEQAPSARR